MGSKKKKKVAAGDATKGERLFKNLCGVCHSLIRHETGPCLAGVGESNIASCEGFAYSEALTSRALDNWSAANLGKWLKSPSDFAPGNTMAFAGIPSAKDRADLVAYLMEI